MVTRAYKLRLRPSADQRRALAQWFGHARFAWNWALDARQKAYRRRGETLNGVALSATFTKIKRSRPWLYDVPSAIPQQAMRDIDAGYEAFRAGRVRHPRFKSRRRAAQSARVQFDYRSAGKARAWKEGTVVLPKIGRVKTRGRALPEAMPQLITVKHDACGRYWLSFTVKDTPQEAPEPFRASIGVDVGARRLATVAGSEQIVAHVQHPRALNARLKQLEHAQQRIAKQCKGSQRRARTKQRIARIHRAHEPCQEHGEMRPRRNSGSA